MRLKLLGIYRVSAFLQLLFFCGIIKNNAFSDKRRSGRRGEAGTMDQSCATQYPIMLIHGIGYRDKDYRKYWGRIPDFLKERGASLYFGNQEPFGFVRQNAACLKESAEFALKDSGAKKLNLIAHSKGGIEARYLISRLGMADRIASLTTIATPHRGICTMDELKARSDRFYKALVLLFNTMLQVDGGEKNPSLSVYEQMTADYMKVFNQLTPDKRQVYYQSYAFDMKNTVSHPAMGIFYSLVKKSEGRNDGLVSVESAKWGNFRGVYSGPGACGISHPGAVDYRRKAVTDKRTGGGLLDITHLYWDIAEGLKDMGF